MTHTKKEIIPELAPFPRHRGWLLGLGVLLLILGCVGLSMEFLLTVASMYFFATLLIISGVSHFVDAFKYKHVTGALWQVLIAFLYVMAGLVVFYDPLLASTLLTAFLAWILIIIGASRITMAIYLRHTKTWGWIIVAGMASLVLGILILLQWPVSGLWVIGMFIVIDLIVSGWTYILMALTLKRIG